MRCPKCGGATRVVDSRKVEGSCYRRRVCTRCEEVVETREDLVSREEYRRIRCLVDKQRPVHFPTTSCGVGS
jgi:transcriptional regulator NrdR family protein